MASMLKNRQIDSSYDTGNDIQPGVSWANPNTDSFPSTDATLTNSPTTTHTTFNSADSGNVNQSAESSFENEIPLDREDSLRLTKALPFADSGATEIQTQIQSEEFPTRRSSSLDLMPDYSDLHNGNILDRTMDQIRSWVHSLKHGEPQYEEVEIDDHAASSTFDNAKSRMIPTKDSLSNKVSSSASSTKDSLSSVAKTTSDTTSNKLSNIKDSVLHTVNDYTHSVSETMNSSLSGVSGSVNALTDTVKARANDLVHTVSDTASSTLSNVKSSVTGYIQQHQQSPNESLAKTMTNTVSSALPSQTQIKSFSSNYLPPLMQQASGTYLFIGSFLTNYLMTYKDFVAVLRKESLPLQIFTGMMILTHAVLPWFFLDKSAARSVLYCYFLASIFGHGTFFISRSLRYMFLSHLVFLPMFISLSLHHGFNEAGDVSSLIDSFHKGENVHTMFAAPLSLRSYLFILWLRFVLMNQATLFTLDVVNISNLLGLSLDTQRGQESRLIQSRVKYFRRQLAHNIHGAANTLETDSSSVQHQQPRSRKNSNATKYSPAFKSSNFSSGESTSTGSGAKTSPQPSSRSLSPQPQQQHQHKWVKKDNAEQISTVQTKEGMVESHEKPQHSSNSELRQRNAHSQQKSQNY